MDLESFTGERVTLTTSRSYGEVVAAIERAVAHPNVPELFAKMKAAATADELRRVVEAAAGSLGVLEFIRFDFGLVLGKADPPTRRGAVRFLLGNPLVIPQIVGGAPDAGAHAPVTVVVEEREGAVRVTYERLASLLGPGAEVHARDAARAVDAKIERLVAGAAGVA